MIKAIEEYRVRHLGNLFWTWGVSFREIWHAFREELL
jgi:hypothetical protein